jgi:hypothetical protein
MQDRDPNLPADRASVKKIRKYWPVLAFSLLGLAVLIQLTLLGNDTFREIPRLISDLGQPAAWRSATYRARCCRARSVAFCATCQAWPDEV